MSKLFLICPDCHIEQAVRNHYENDCFFLTALGTVFEIESFEHAEDVNILIHTEQVSAIYILNDICCSFISNVLNNKTAYPTKAEITLKSIYRSQQHLIEAVDDFTHKAKLLARENIHRQALELLDAAFIGNKIRDGSIQVFGLIYTRETGEFEEFRVPIP